MSKVDYSGKCGTCQKAERLFGSRTCYCTDEAVGRGMRYSLSRKGCKQYAPLDYKDGSIERDILCFIGRFSHGPSQVREQVIEAFTMGCCFWFARILEERFEVLGPEIVVDNIVNHFGTRINGRVYDITGDVTESYTWEPWEEFKEPNRARQITKDCILF